MNCPSCQMPLIVLEHALLEVDFCTGCKGIWLDAGELELLLGDSRAVGGVLGEGVPAAGEQLRRCPICRTKMAKTATSGSQPVTYDICRAQHGMWFDAGELEKILAHGAAEGRGGEVSRWLRDVFGRSAARD